MTRAEVIAWAKDIARTKSSDERMVNYYDVLAARTAIDLLVADGGRTHYDAAAVERERIREALVEQLALHDRHPRFAVLAEDIEREIERICGPAPVVGSTSNTAHEVDADWSGDPLKDTLSVLECEHEVVLALRRKVAKYIGKARDNLNGVAGMRDAIFDLRTERDSAVALGRELARVVDAECGWSSYVALGAKARALLAKGEK